MNIKMLFIDVDGTLTDGKLYYGINGDEYKAFNVKDGLGIKKISSYGVKIVIITGRHSEALLKRIEELEVFDFYQSVKNKETLLKSLIKKYNIEFKHTAYIGDDENDYFAMKQCGFKACPKDAIKKIINISDYVSDKKGGDGAVREIIEYILSKKEGKIK